MDIVQEQGAIASVDSTKNISLRSQPQADLLTTTPSPADNTPPPRDMTPINSSKAEASFSNPTGAPPQAQASLNDQFDQSLLPAETQSLLAYLEKLGDACSSRMELQHQESTGNYDETASAGPSNPPANPPASPPANPPATPPSTSSSSSSSFLTAAELSQLAIKVSSLSSKSLPADFLDKDDSLLSAPYLISVDQLQPLFNDLHALVREGSAIDLPNSALKFFNYNTLQAANSDPKYQGNMKEFLNSTEFKELSSSTGKSIQAASSLLSLMAFKGVDRRCLSEDIIENVILAVKWHVSKHVNPVLDPTVFKMKESADKTATANNNNTDTTTNNTETNHTDTDTSSTITTPAPLLPELLKSIPQILGFLESLRAFVERVPLGDSQLLTISNMLMETLTLSPPAHCPRDTLSLLSSLHLIALSTLRGIFQQYPRHRTIMLEDMFPMMLRLPSSRKHLRTYPVDTYSILNVVEDDEDGIFEEEEEKTQNVDAKASHIQMVSALTLFMIQSAATNPSQPTGGLSQPNVLVDYFVNQLLSRTNKKSLETTNPFKHILTNFVDDLLSIQTHAMFPSAIVFLKQFSATIAIHLFKARDKSSTMEPSYLNVCFETLGKIAANFATHMVVLRTNPLRIPLNEDQEVDADAKPEAATENTKCICNRPHITNTFMLDCDGCHKWFHGNCVQIRKDAIPETWYCDECVMIQVAKEQQAAAFGLFDELLPSSSSGGSGAGGARRVSVTPSKQSRLEEEKAEKEKQSKMEKICFRQLLLNYLSAKDSETDENVEFARRFQICKWVEDLDCDIIEVEGEEGAAPSSPVSPAAKKKQKKRQKKKRKTKAEQEAELSEAEAKARVKLQNKITNHQIAHLLQQWEVNPEATKKQIMATNNGLTSFASSKLLQTVNALTDIAETFPRLLGTILRLMEDELTSLRKPAVKALNQVISADPRLMFHKIVKKTVADCFVDEAISVREAAVTLVGSFVLKTPKIAFAYHASLLDRLNDEGVSVRKSAVKIFKDVLLNQPLYPQRAAVCHKLVQSFSNPKEEESIRDHIYDIFMKLWFSQETNTSNSNSAVKVGVGFGGNDSLEELVANGSKTPLNTKKEGGGLAAAAITPGSAISESQSTASGVSGLFSPAALQIIEVVAISKDTSFLKHLVHDLLFSLGEGENVNKAQLRKKRRAEAEDHCAKIVAQCSEELVCFDEEANANSATPKSLAAIASTLSVFASAAPALVLPHLDTILPYLKANGAGKQAINPVICSKLCNVLSSVAPILSRTQILQLANSEVAEDLTSMSYKCGAEVISESIKALSFLAAHKVLRQPNNSLKVQLFKLARTFYAHLHKMMDICDDLGRLKATVRANILRAISVIGAVCCYNKDNWVEGDHVLAEEGKVVDPNRLQYANLSINCFNLLRVYLNKRDAETKCATLKALQGVFIGRPKLMLVAEQLGLIDEVMDDIMDVVVQRQALDSWCCILESQEVLIEALNRKEAAKMAGNGTLGGFTSPEKSITKRISGDQDSDACLAGGVLTAKSDFFYAFCMNSDGGLRMSAVKLIGRLLRQGLINPNDAIPRLLALQGDVGEGGVRGEALKLLAVEGEKRPEMLRQRVRRGIELGMKLQLKIGRTYSPVIKLPNGNVESVFGRVYADCVRSQKGLRQNLFKSLLNIFVDGDTADRSQGDVKSLHNYVASTLAHLPFTAANEVLNLIHQIDSIVAVDGNALLDHMSKAVKALGWSDGGGDGEESEEGGEISEEGIESLFGLAWDGEEAKDFKGKLPSLIEKADGVVVLLRLKYFLMQIYNIAESKIEEYQASEQGRAVSLTLPDVMPIFDVLNANLGYDGPVEKNEDLTTGEESLDLLCWSFVNFRRLMCEFVEDYELTRAATKVVVVAKKEERKKRKRKEKEEEEEEEEVELDDDDFDDDEPLFVQKQRLAEAKAKEKEKKKKELEKEMEKVKEKGKTLKRGKGTKGAVVEEDGDEYKEKGSGSGEAVDGPTSVRVSKRFKAQ
ncbi:hypothetical protein TrVE_jg528 [Triparma verrucosa]|uniref:Sister chromatid cohesion protein n=1 Tax=Triparma verrucosa TaxID=1606542 RepID=A0A9W7EL18_9STRA|nr:hypothetical protein TrVE_jg528 [Triparma verrucosa]